MKWTYSLTKVSIQAELAAGTRLQAKLAAFMMKSFTDSFTPSFDIISFSSPLRLKQMWY